MALEVQSPFPTFLDVDGSPLDRGHVYIGLAGLNPVANPQSAYWDDALTVPAYDLRTVQGFLTNNGAASKLYVANDYSIAVTNKNGRVVYSCLTMTNVNTNMLLTRPRGSLVRSMLTPLTYDLNLILESGLYSWTNNGASNIPAGCAANDTYKADVASAPDNGGLVHQVLYDMTNGPTSIAYKFARQSVDGGVTFTGWLNQSLGIGQTGTKYIPYVDAAGRMGVGRAPTNQTFEVAGSISTWSGATAYAALGITGTDAFVGNAANTNLLFIRNGAEKARIDTNDYLLVGYSSSQGAHKAQVNGNVYLSGNVVLLNAGAILFGSTYLGSDATGTKLGWGRTPTTYALEVQGDGYFVKSTAVDTQVQIENLSTANAAKINLISGNGTTSGRFNFLYFRANETVAQAWVLGNYGTKNFIIQDATSSVNSLTITAGSTKYITIGTVGIGINTTAGTYAVEVNGAAYASAGFISASNIALPNGSYLMNSGGDSWIMFAASGKVGVLRNPATYSFEVGGSIFATGEIRASGWLYTNTAFTTPVIYCENNTGLKIGATSAASVMLDVAGDIKSSLTMIPTGGITENGVTLKRKVINIGDWNMDTTAVLTVAHGLTLANIRRITACIRDDANTSVAELAFASQNASLTNIGGGCAADATNINLYRMTSGVYDSTNYDSTSYNRGWIFIDYVA